MRNIVRQRKAQSLMEYAMLIIVITTALMAMYVYMRRSVNAHLQTIVTELDETKR